MDDLKKQKKPRAPLLGYIKLCALSQSHQWIQTGDTIRKCSIPVKIGVFLSRVTSKYEGWPWKTIGHASIVLQVCESFHNRPSIQTGVTVRQRHIWVKMGDFLSHVTWHLTDDLTLKNNRAPLLYHIKFCVSFHCHMRIQIGATVRKQLSWILTSTTLTFDLWTWSFELALLLAIVITPDNFMKIRWWEHSEKGVGHGQTDGRTDWTIHRAAWSQLKCLP